MLYLFSRAGNSQLTYNPENGTMASPLSEAVLRTLVADWVDPSRQYDTRPTSPTSAAWIRIIKAFAMEFSEEVAAAETVGIIDDPSNLFFADEMQVIAPIMAEIHQGPRSESSHTDKEGMDRCCA